MDKKLAFELSYAYGISGFEGNIKKIMQENMSANVDEFFVDNLGSLIGIKKGPEDGPKIMLAAHMDEIGFIVNKIDDNGYLYFTTVGGWWSQVLLGQRVRIVNKDGKSFVGVIGSTPPHVLPKEKRDEVVKIENMFIDLGAKDKEEVLKNNIDIGDMIVPDSIATDMLNDDYILGKAWDNRIGCLLMLEIMKELKDIELPNTVYAVATTQEEIGLKGAKTSSYTVNPDIAFALDTGIAGDVPNFPEHESKHKLGGGPLYVVMDAAMIINPRFKQYIDEMASRLNIPIHPEIMTGGATDAGSITVNGSGVIGTCISIATRYIHSHNSIISKKDVDYAKELVVNLLKDLDSKRLEEILGHE